MSSNTMSSNNAVVSSPLTPAYLDHDGPMAKPAAPPAGAPPSNDPPSYDDLLARNAELLEKITRSELALESARVAEATAKIARTDVDFRPGELIARRTRLVGQFGNARWHQIPFAERLRLQGVEGVTDAEIKNEIPKVFGPNSSAEASILMKSNPARYQRLWVINYELTH